MDKQKQTNKIINSLGFIKMRASAIKKELVGRALLASRPLVYLILNKLFKGQLELVLNFTRMIIIRKEVKVQYSFILPLVLSKIEWAGVARNINTEPITSDYYLAVGVLSVTALVSFYIAMVYFFSIYLVQHYNIEEKYPKFNKIIKYYEKTGFYFIIFSCIVCVVALLILCVTGFLLYYKFIVLN